MNLEDAVKIKKALQSSLNYCNENPNDPKQTFPFHNPPLTQIIDEAMPIIEKELEELGYYGNMQSMYHAGTMFSDEFSDPDHNPT